MQFPEKIEDRLGYVSFSVAGGGGSQGGGQPQENPDQEAAEKRLEKQVEDGDANAEDVQEATGKEKEQSFLQKAVNTVKDVSDAISNVGDALNDVLDSFNGNQPAVKSIKRGTANLVSPDGQVVLYLPAGFQMNEGVQYDQTDLGIAGAGAEAAINAGGNLTDALAGSATGFLDALKSDVGSPQARLAALETAKRAAKIDAGIIAGAQSAAGVTVNPNQRVLFKRVNIREFAFNFTLVPVSSGEAATVNQMIKFFRHYLYPEPIGDEIKVGYKFPEKFNIKVGSSLGWNAPEIKPCYLRNVAVTYNPNAIAFHEDGNPVETQLSLNFVEASALDRTDVPL